MSKINQAIKDIHYMDKMVERDVWMNHIHPFVKVVITFLYIILVVSFHKYNLIGLAGMCVYPIIIMGTNEISLKRTFRQLKLILILVCFVGIANPILDRHVILHIGTLPITTGLISMLSLMVKGIFTILASYLLIVTTSIEKICYALRLMHLPKMIVTMVMLIYRYLIVMMQEVNRITTAYAMRAPGQKGVSYKAWGTLAGQMLLRSIDRAQYVYESMSLRGFQGEYVFSRRDYNHKASIIFFVFMIVILFTIRFVAIFQVVGNIFV